jgi:hypothetical protein
MRLIKWEVILFDSDSAFDSVSDSASLPPSIPIHLYPSACLTQCVSISNSNSNSISSSHPHLHLHPHPHLELQLHLQLPVSLSLQVSISISTSRTSITIERVRWERLARGWWDKCVLGDSISAAHLNLSVEPFLSICRIILGFLTPLDVH